jgi:hypothetical protein
MVSRLQRFPHDSSKAVNSSLSPKGFQPAALFSVRSSGNDSCPFLRSMIFIYQEKSASALIILKNNKKAAIFPVQGTIAAVVPP